jgi:hypothetical protein
VDRGPLVDDDLLGVRAPSRAHRDDHRDHAVADGQAPVGVGTELVDRVGPDPDLAGAGFGIGQVDDVEDVGAAELGEADRFHAQRSGRCTGG